MVSPIPDPLVQKPDHLRNRPFHGRRSQSPAHALFQEFHIGGDCHPAGILDSLPVRIPAERLELHHPFLGDRMVFREKLKHGRFVHSLVGSGRES